MKKSPKFAGVLCTFFCAALFTSISLAQQGNSPDHQPNYGNRFDPPGLDNDPVLHDAPDSVNAHHPVRFRPLVTTSPSGYLPAQIRHAYGFDQIALTGAGQKIAIVVAYGSPTLQSDLNTFCDATGTPRTTVSIYYPQGKPAGADSGWALETSLDAQWAHAIAPGASLHVVVAKSSSLNDLLKAVDYAAGTVKAQQVAMSWGAPEFSGCTMYDNHFKKNGVSFFAASGDSGAGVYWPAVSQYVVGVGGTTLVLDGSNNRVSENAWNLSGGGISSYVLRPAYQNIWQTAAGRGVPDVCYNADPNTGFSVYMSNYNGTTGWFTVGGTSAGAPQWAALSALVNSARRGALTGADTALYSVANSSNLADYKDILSGLNGTYSALTGYDYVTGLGSPVSPLLVPALVSY